MTFTPIDREHWARKEYFDHYFTQVPCTYSAVFKLDITRLRQQGQKLYPTMLYHIAAEVNCREEFRTALDGAGRLGVYDRMHPCYTIFHKDSETFSNLWTEYTPDYEAFCEAYRRDMAEYGGNPGIEAKPGTPENTFPVSMLPWASFEGFNLNLQKGYDFLLPIFTMGKYYDMIRATRFCFLWRCRYTTRYATVSTCAVSSMVCKSGWDTLSPFVLALSHGGENFFEHKAAVITGGAKALTEIAREKNCPILGEFSCKGYDTFGPFKLVGGIAKGHPDARDLENARSFFRQIQNRLC